MAIVVIGSALAPARIQYSHVGPGKDNGRAACRGAMTFSRGIFRAAASARIPATRFAPRTVASTPPFETEGAGNAGRGALDSSGKTGGGLFIYCPSCRSGNGREPPLLPSIQSPLAE
jgi:hypothetical protein